MEKFEPNIEQKKYLKELRWESTVRDADIIIDGIGKRIDPGIKETVVGLMVNDYETTGSCEGHLDRGLPYPWIDIDLPSEESLFKEFPNYEKDLQTIKEKGYPDSKIMKNSDPALYDRMLSVQNYAKKVRLETKNKILSLLSEFYSSNKPYSEEGKIEVHDTGSGFRVELNASKGIGLDKWKIFDEKISKMAIDERKKFLENNQNEMKAFTEFLKDKFFS